MEENNQKATPEVKEALAIDNSSDFSPIEKSKKPFSSGILILGVGIILAGIILVLGVMYWDQFQDALNLDSPKVTIDLSDKNESTQSGEEETQSQEENLTDEERQINATVDEIDQGLEEVDSILNDLDAIDQTQDNLPTL